eukprot:14312280-Heterocapsa_arctica.AAC.1
MCPRSWLPKVMTKLTITKKGYENYNQFSLLEDADGSDGSSEDGQEEIMFVSESTSTSISACRWTKISAIVDSGLGRGRARAPGALAPEHPDGGVPRFESGQEVPLRDGPGDPEPWAEGPHR